MAEIMIPEVIMKQLELRRGAAVIVQGVPTGKNTEFFLRVRSGLEVGTPARTPFTAAVRFRNRPKVLAQFLTAASERQIQFQTIRTFGYRAKDESELVFEGSVPDKELHFVHRYNVRALLDEIVVGIKDTEGKAEAAVITHEVLRFTDFMLGLVSSTAYRIEIPVLRERFLKIRLEVPEDWVLPEDRLDVARLGLELDSMTVTIGTELRKARSYILVFEGRDLAGEAVTQAIVDALPRKVNVDAISAYEYRAFDPDVEGGDPRDLRPLGRIEMLCVAPEIHEWDYKDLQRDIRAAIAVALKGESRIKTLTLTPITDHLTELYEDLQNSREGITTRDALKDATFYEYLNDKYVRREMLGEGSFGKVYRYMDLSTLEDVAGKHFYLLTLEAPELSALIDPVRNNPSPHLVKLKDYFLHDAVPVIVTEFLPVILANNQHNKRNRRALGHQHPRSLRDFVRMATQICEGLQVLHARRQAADGTDTDVGYVHRDIKPENIGAAIADGKLVWKLIDFGLAKKYATSSPGEGTLKGTPRYMSPQALAEQKSPTNDIFALGVTFFEVLCNWEHPTSMQDWGTYPGEVAKYLAYLTRLNGPRPEEAGAEPPGYDVARFVLGPPFNDERLPGAATHELRDIVYQMMAMSQEARFRSAGEVRQALADWWQKWDGQLGDETLEYATA